MNTRAIFIVAGLGFIGAIVSAFVFGIQPKTLPPAFAPAANPYAQAIYAEGIIESEQSSGENINLNPEVTGPVTRIFVREGQHVHSGDPLVAVDNSVQRATTQQQQNQAQAAKAILEELKAEPRGETLEVTHAQWIQAQANLKLMQDQRDKQRRSFDLDPRSVSREAVDTAENNVKVAAAAADVAERQYKLTKAGAWVYDIRNQQGQFDALTSAYQASHALLDKFVIKAPADGDVLAVNASLGGYVAPQGVYDTYTQGEDPVVVMSAGGAGELQVRCYIDEILLQRLPPARSMVAQMSVRGSDKRIPLRFVRIQPYLSPKIELSDQRQERVDLRVLPVVFSFSRTPGVAVYPGQLVDVFIGRR